MYRKILKVMVLGAMLVTALVGASTASATNWQSNGSAAGTPFTATAGPVKVRINVPSNLNFNCTGSSLTGNVFGPVGPANTGPWNGVETTVPAFSACTVAGLTVATSLTVGGVVDALSYTAPVTTDKYTFTFTAKVTGCVFTIAVNAATQANNTAGTFAVQAAGQSTVASWPNSTGCDTITGTGPSDPDSASAVVTANTTPATDLVYTYTSAFTPSVFY
jgi:hypothetical protein